MDATARNAANGPAAQRLGCTPDLLHDALRIMHEAGVPISTGTDYVLTEGEPDPTLFKEIEYLVEAGVLTPAEAITAATLNGAQAIGIDSLYGTVEPGKRADLVVLGANPPKDIDALRNIRAVIKHGRLVPGTGPIRCLTPASPSEAGKFPPSWPAAIRRVEGPAIQPLADTP